MVLFRTPLALSVILLVTMGCTSPRDVDAAPPKTSVAPIDDRPFPPEWGHGWGFTIHVRDDETMTSEATVFTRSRIEDDSMKHSGVHVRRQYDSTQLLRILESWRDGCDHVFEVRWDADGSLLGREPSRLPDGSFTIRDGNGLTMCFNARGDLIRDQSGFFENGVRIAPFHAMPIPRFHPNPPWPGLHRRDESAFDDSR